MPIAVPELKKLLGEKFIRIILITVYLLTFGGLFIPPILGLAGLANLSDTAPIGLFIAGVGMGIVIGSGVYERRILKLPLAPQKIVCSSCGRENSPFAIYCDRCGKKVASEGIDLKHYWV